MHITPYRFIEPACNKSAFPICPKCCRYMGVSLSTGLSTIDHHRTPLPRIYIITLFFDPSS